MAETVVFSFSAAGTQTWVAPRTVDVYPMTVNANFLISISPTRTIADITAPSANIMFTDVLFYKSGVTATHSSRPFTVLAGQKIFITAGAAGVLVLNY
jgi:hypothetical protein